jgi:hypothetical protein
MDLKQVKIGKKLCYLFNRQVLIGDHFMLNVFGPYGIIFMNVCCNRCHGIAVGIFGHMG